MIKITVCNETKRDRNILLQVLNKAEVNGNIFFEEIPAERTATFLSEDHTIICLSCNDIFYFEYINRKIRIVTTDREYICINEKISDIAKRMRPYGFAMCHQSFVVNLYKIEKVRTQELVMMNGDRVYMAQKRAAAIRKELRSQSGKILL